MSVQGLVITPEVPLRHYGLMERHRQLFEEMCPFRDISAASCVSKHLITPSIEPLATARAAKGPNSMCMTYIGHVEHGHPWFLYRLSAVFLATLGF